MNIEKIVNGYLSALGISDIKTLEDVNKLQKTHLQTFAFSSMKVLLKEDISLELEDIYNSIVVQKRGGYCFEHNKLIYEVLNYFGFDVQNVLARVILTRTYVPPLTHRFTLLNYENDKYIIDAGVGSNAPYTIVKFGDEKTVDEFGVEYEVIAENNGFFILKATRETNSIIISKFKLDECYDLDFELGHFYSHKHPKAAFVNNLAVAKFEQDKALSLVNKTFRKIYLNNTEVVEINNGNKLYAILKNEFNLNYTEEEVKSIYKIL